MAKAQKLQGRLPHSNRFANRFDSEALGLVLFALGIFILVTLMLPSLSSSENGADGNGIMSQIRRALLDWLGWGAYLLPLIPVSYGVLIFLGRGLRALTRRVCGGLIIVLALLMAHELLSADEAGQLASQLITPLFMTVGQVAYLPIVILLTLGLELMLRLSAFSMLKGFFRWVSVLLGGASAGVQGVIEARQDDRETAQTRSQLRQGLLHLSRQIQALSQWLPEEPRLQQQLQQVRAAQKSLKMQDEDGLKRLARDLEAWTGKLRTHVANESHQLERHIEREAPTHSQDIEALHKEVSAGRHELSVDLASTQASGELELIRRHIVQELQRLVWQAGRLERERQGALEALKVPEVATYARERQAQEVRQKGWKEFESEYLRWRELEKAYPGWPDLAAAYDRAPTEVAAALAQALRRDPYFTLGQKDEWRGKLGDWRTGISRPVDRPEPKPDVSPSASTSQVPTMDFDFRSGQLVEAPVSQTPAVKESRKKAEPLDATPPEEPAPLLGPGDARAAKPAESKTAKPTAKYAPWEDQPEEQAKPAEPRPVSNLKPLALPTVALLDPIPHTQTNTTQLDIAARQRAGVIEQTLRHFNLQARVLAHARGPTVTRYEIEPAPGEKISRISSLSNDLARALAVGGVRVEAPVPGKSVIGLEVPNAEREPVTFHQAMQAREFKQTRAKLPIILGKSIDGELVVADLAKMPHLLVAGSTGSGKSVCVNTLITSLLYKYLPYDLRFLMIDPKMVELTPYDGIPHLVRGVVTNPVDAAGVLLGAVAHMERRYKMMSQVGAKNLEQFNAKMRQMNEPELPHLVIIIDELADLMITSPKEVESAIMRLAQMARATGMHLILATQRPSVDILTSLIKVNIPARIAFAVSSSHDSRTILDSVGAERLTGMGDMLFYQPGLVKPMRLQGPFISELESTRISEELRAQVFEDAFAEAYGADFAGMIESSGPSGDRTNMDFSDPQLRQAALICIEEGQGSVSRLQRRLSVGHAKAGRLMDMLEAMGIVSKHQGSKPREVLISEADLPEYFGR